MNVLCEFVLQGALVVDFTPNSLVVDVAGRGVWLPFCVIVYDQAVRVSETVDVAMPMWLAKQRGLV